MAAQGPRHLTAEMFWWCAAGRCQRGFAGGAMTGGFAGMQPRSEAKQLVAQLYTRAQASRLAAAALHHRSQAHMDGPNNRRGDSEKLASLHRREVQPRRGEGAIVFFADGTPRGPQLSAKQAAWNIDASPG